MGGVSLLGYGRTIQLSKEEVDEAIKEYVSLRNNFKADNIYYIFDHNGELTKAIVDVK